MNATARWSSSSGLLGGWPAAPKLSGVGTRPRPNRCSQTRLTITRAVSGLSLRREPVGQLEPAARRRAIVGGVVVSTCEEAARHDARRGLSELAAGVERAVAGAAALARRPSPAAFGVPSGSNDVEPACREHRQISGAVGGDAGLRRKVACRRCSVGRSRASLAAGRRSASRCGSRASASAARDRRRRPQSCRQLDQRRWVAGSGRRGRCRSRSRCCGRCRPGRSSPAAGSGRTCGRGSGRRRPSGRGTPAWSRRSARRRGPARTAARLRSLCAFGPMARKPVAISCSAFCLVVVGRQQVAGELLA